MVLFYLVAFAALSNTAFTLDFGCPYDGKFANPENRKSFIQCVSGTPSLHNCPETGIGIRHWTLVFNGRECVEPWECPEIDGTYRQSQNGPVYFMCMDGEPTQYTCPYGTRFDGRGCESNSGSPYEHGTFPCPGDGIYNNMFSKTSYVQCVEGRPYVKFCRQYTDGNTTWSLVFDGEKCVQPFECPEIDATFKRHRNGKTHYKCKNGAIEEYHCALDTQFDGRGCKPKGLTQRGRPPHFRVLVKTRNVIKFEFENKVVTDTFDEFASRWNRLIEYNDIV